MKNGIKRWIFKLKYVVAFAIFVGVIGFVGESCLVNRVSQQQEIARLRAEIDEYNRRFEQDRKMLNALKFDDEAVRDVARSRYYMKSDDEDIFIIEGDDE